MKPLELVLRQKWCTLPSRSYNLYSLLTDEGLNKLKYRKNNIFLMYVCCKWHAFFYSACLERMFLLFNCFGFQWPDHTNSAFLTMCIADHQYKIPYAPLKCGARSAYLGHCAGNLHLEKHLKCWLYTWDIGKHSRNWCGSWGREERRADKESPISFPL